MYYLTFKKSLYEGLVFQKPNVSSIILKIDETGITYSIGKKGSYKKVDFDVFEATFKVQTQNGVLKRTWFKEKFPKQ